MITWFENITTFNTPWYCVNVDVVVNKSSFSSTPPCCLFLSYPKKTLSPDSFVNSQEWTLSRTVPDIRLGIVGSLSSGKSALVHRYLTGSYMQVSTYIYPTGYWVLENNILLVGGESWRGPVQEGDCGGWPKLSATYQRWGGTSRATSDYLIFKSCFTFRFQFTSWVDAVIFVFSLENETSFNAIYNYYAKMAQYRNIQDVPLILVGTQGINSFPLFFLLLCVHHFSPVKFRLKTFLMSEDRFQYKGTAHSKLTRPAWWYLTLWIIDAWHRGVLRSFK